MISSSFCTTPVNLLKAAGVRLSTNTEEPAEVCLLIVCRRSVQGQITLIRKRQERDTNWQAMQVHSVRGVFNAIYCKQLQTQIQLLRTLLDLQSCSIRRKSS